MGLVQDCLMHESSTPPYGLGLCLVVNALGTNAQVLVGYLKLYALAEWSAWLAIRFAVPMDASVWAAR